MMTDNFTSASKQVARWFINQADLDSGEGLTPLKLQKLIYYAQAWALANFDCPLFDDNFQAWAHGPALPEIYAKYRRYAWNPLPVEQGPLPSDKVRGFLQAVLDEYGQYSAKKLETMTHKELPWKEARGNLPPEASSTERIKKLTMRNYYAERLGKDKIEKL